MLPNIKGVKNGVNRIQPGLGVGYLGAVLRDAGHEVYIRDTALEGYDNERYLENELILIGESEESIASYIANLNPDVLGISAIFSNLMDHAHTIARIAKDVNPEIKVVLGGNHISNAVTDYQFALRNHGTGLPGELIDMQDKNIDFAMRGEVEYQFLELVNRLVNGQDINDIPGLIYRENGMLRINPQPPPLDDLNRLPAPARDLTNMEKYFHIGLFQSSKSRSKRVLTVMASRGCPERCTFCTTPLMWGSKVRCRSPQNVYREIKEGIEKYNIGEVQFADDTLTANLKNLLELCDLLEPLGIPWCTPNGIRLDYHHKGNKQYELFKRMKDAGCYQVTLACESGVQRVLNDIIHKNLKIEQIQPTVETAKEAGLLVHTFWIVGYPGETREEMEETINFAARISADSYSVSILTPLPGTQIYRQVMKENLWWEKSSELKNSLYTKSLIKVHGFDSPGELEEWIDKKTVYLNELLKQRDPKRFYSHYKNSHAGGFLRQQT